MQPTESYWRGIALLNRGQYFEAHEVLEDVWRESSPPERLFLQALIQVAVGLHHVAHGNREGALGVLRRAAANLSPYPASFGEIRTDLLLSAIQSWLIGVENGQVEELPLPGQPIVQRSEFSV